MIFDEVITGFRLSLGGAQQYYNIKPDITTLGKIVGGGMPIGAYGGRREIMQMISPDGPVYQAGTLSGNPVATTAGIETLNILKNEEHVKWAKNSADKAVTLVKDTAGILPLSPRKTKKVLLEIMGDFPSNERVLESFRTKLSDEGFEVTVYEHENFETARFDVETFKKSYDLVIYIGNVENASNKVTNRLSWYTILG